MPVDGEGNHLRDERPMLIFPTGKEAGINPQRRRSA
jgi:hypothetical protein